MAVPVSPAAPIISNAMPVGPNKASFHLRDSFLKHFTVDLDRWAHPTMHFPISSACTTYMAIPISSWDQKFKSWNPGSHSTKLMKE